MRFPTRTVLTALLLLICSAGDPTAREGSPYHSPWFAAYSPDSKTLAVSDFTADSVELVDATSGAVRQRVSVAEPAEITWASAGSRCYVAGRAGRDVVELDGSTGRILRRFSVGGMPTGLALASQHGLLLCGNVSTRDLSVIDLARGVEKARIACTGEPFGIAVTPDESFALAGNLIPIGDATRPDDASLVDVFDLRNLRRTCSIRLPAGSTLARGIAISPEGRWAYVVHTIGHFNLPTTQLDRGWVNTNALTILDLASRKVYATVLLDLPDEGATEPWGIALAPDGKTAWITLTGVHQVIRLEMARLHDLLEGGAAAPPNTIWADIRRDPSQRTRTMSDLSALNAANLVTRIPLPGKGPRSLSMAPDGSHLAAPLYFGGSLALIDPESGKVDTNWTLGASPAPDAARRGEIDFHDATLSYQHWLACSTCHPEARADGLNWDLLNDGIGNPKNTRSLLQAETRGPMMSQGVRSDFHSAVQAGFRFILFREPQGTEVRDVEAYLTSLRPEPSPYRRPDGQLSERARQGKSLFLSPGVGCSHCHTGPYFTDLKLHDVGTRGPIDNTGLFVTPPLIEAWRTPPYLHDGRAVIILELLTIFNKNDKHGNTSKLSKAQSEDLAEFVLSQ